jgi:branched-chain amino acid transport system ATP-binding protein
MDDVEVRGRRLLEVEGVRKLFGSLVAVDDVSFKVKAGEIFGIAGPNGAGKTTLFNLITGIPFAGSGGRISFDGHRIERMAAHRIFSLGLARTFQREASFGNLTVEQNIQLGARFGTHFASGDRAHAVDEMLDLFDLRGCRDELAGSLPVYTTKRIMLASAVVSQPKILMLDEPASGLNTAEVADIQRLILNLRDRGMAIILIEHILPLLFGISGRVMVMDFGRKLTEGTPADIARDDRVIEAYLGGQGKTVVDALGY